MIDTRVVGMNWIEIPAGNYSLRTEKSSCCQIELDVEWDAFVSHTPVGEWSKLLPCASLALTSNAQEERASSRKQK